MHPGSLVQIEGAQISRWNDVISLTIGTQFAKKGLVKILGEQDYEEDEPVASLEELVQLGPVFPIIAILKLVRLVLL